MHCQCEHSIFILCFSIVFFFLLVFAGRLVGPEDPFEFVRNTQFLSQVPVAIYDARFTHTFAPNKNEHKCIRNPNFIILWQVQTTHRSTITTDAATNDLRQ